MLTVSLLYFSSLSTLLDDEKPGSFRDHNKIRFMAWLLFHLYLKRVKALKKYLFHLFKGIVVWYPKTNSCKRRWREFLAIFLSFAFSDVWLYLLQSLNFLLMSKVMSKISQFWRLCCFSFHYFNLCLHDTLAGRGSELKESKKTGHSVKRISRDFSFICVHRCLVVLASKFKFSHVCMIL